MKKITLITVLVYGQKCGNFGERILSFVSWVTDFGRFGSELIHVSGQNPAAFRLPDDGESYHNKHKHRISQVELVPAEAAEVRPAYPVLISTARAETCEAARRTR